MLTETIVPSSRRAPAPDTVAELMTRRVAVCHQDETVALAQQMMLWRGVRHLPVLDADGGLVGILSDRDVLRALAERSPGAHLREVMTHPVQTVAPGTSATEASAILCAGHIDCLPVVQAGRLVGIVTSRDILAERGRVLHKGGPGQMPTAADVMRTGVRSVAPTDSLASALRELVDADIRHLPVVDEDDHVVGMLSDRDVRSAVGDPREAAMREERNDALATLRVEDVMTPSAIAVAARSSILVIADALLDEKVGALPVVDDEERLVGIVSYVDVLAHLVGRGS